MTQHTYESLRDAVVQASMASTSTRQTIVSACGTGKTRQQIGLFNAYAPKLTLVLEPTLGLIHQSLLEWKTYAEGFSSLIICSDPSVTKDDLDLVTLDPRDIIDFISDESDTRVIFCTYQSSYLLADVFASQDLPAIDLALYDEAHLTAVSSTKARFAITLEDVNVPIKKRIFFTATPRIYGDGDDAISMDDVAIYGNIIFNYSNKEAIADGLIKDFDIVIATVSDKNVSHLITQEKVLGTSFGNLSAEAGAVHIAVAKAIQEYQLKQIISFYSTTQKARQAAVDFEAIAPYYRLNWASLAVYGGMKSSEVKNAIARLQKGQVILNNCRLIGTGINIPTIDGLVFADPKTSITEIVQNIGRGQRKVDENDTTPLMVILPLVVDASGVTRAYRRLIHILGTLKSEEDLLAFSNVNYCERVNLKNMRHGVIKFLNCDKVIDKEFFDSIKLQVLDYLKSRSVVTLSAYLQEKIDAIKTYYVEHSEYPPNTHPLGKFLQKINEERFQKLLGLTPAHLDFIKKQLHG